jgi:hypothetical protein
LRLANFHHDRGRYPFLRVTCLHYLRHQELHAAQVAERLARDEASAAVGAKIFAVVA